MRMPIIAMSVLAAFLALSIALFGHKPVRSLEELQVHCEDTLPEHNRARVKACRYVLRRQGHEEWYRGAIYAQLCVALVKAGRWQKAVEACTSGNELLPLYHNYLNRAHAYTMLGEKTKAADDLTQAQLLKHRQD